ncbi:MAG: T9SS type A sorting domain-containing protein [Candidatus Marinimicrobia bacterium]|nr:T9SS type A sorting domain-containing protein [Candidatus Neomarinimicrobiota bacterium]
MPTKCTVSFLTKLSLMLIISIYPNTEAMAQGTPQLPGFTRSAYFGEQVVTFQLSEDMTIHINAASLETFMPDKPAGLALFALPNGNTIEQTVGKTLQPSDDWHYDIQHIGAQTRFLRNRIQDHNLITVYLEAKQRSWPTWKTNYVNYDDIIRTTIEYLLGCFKDYDPFIILTGHSGGGRFIFSYLDGVTDIPDYVKRICFLDSNYGYEHVYGDQFIKWLNDAPDRFLSVIAYNDSVALYNGAPIVSATGGTWYRTRMMQRYLANQYTFTSVEDESMIIHKALNGRIEIQLKKNPTQAILHTIQVERNGFIHTILSGTSLAEVDYTYYGERAYSDLIQSGVLNRPNYQIPLRNMDAPNGSQFMTSLIGMSFSDREKAILNQLLTGNVPYFLRELNTHTTSALDAQGASHTVSYRSMPDYLSIGTDSNYCRVPMGPITAQQAADFFGMSMPTRKLVNQIYVDTDIKLAPVTYPWVPNESESVEKFMQHNDSIEVQLSNAGASLGQSVGGTKKDVVLSNLIIDPTRFGHVTIYGWHQLNGSPIQPLTNIHINTYVDYSHGIRLLDAQVTVDGEIKTLSEVLKDPLLFSLLSDESGRMVQPSYISDGALPARPSSFGAVTTNPGRVDISIKPDPNVQQYQVYTSTDGLQFSDALLFSSNTISISDLDPDAIFYFKLSAENSAGISLESEILAVLPSGLSDKKVLIVNGFDRNSTGNTHDFIRQHGGALMENGISFESVTNDAIIDGLVDLKNYLIVDCILGEESTVDETFSNSEQILFANYLKQGGRLFVSGAEIAWDLDYKAITSSDRSFMHDYLKASYSADAPGGSSGIYYEAEGIEGDILGSLASIQYDNGSHGTFNVKYPDALIPENGGQSIVRYKQVNTHNIGGIRFEGVFPGGNQAGKLVYLGFPFETVYPAGTRNALMKDIMDYLTLAPSSTREQINQLPEDFVLEQNYPNPFNPNTTLQFGIPTPSQVRVSIYDTRGRTVKSFSPGYYPAGWHELDWTGHDDQGQLVATGMYLARMQVVDPSTSSHTSQSIKMLYLK